MKNIPESPSVSSSIRGLVLAALASACSATATGTSGDVQLDASHHVDASVDAPDVTDRAQVRDVVSENNDVSTAIRLELFSATADSHQIGTSQVVGMFARVRQGNRPLLHQEVRLSMLGGGGGQDTVVMGYSSDMASDQVMMDHVCVNTTGTSVVSGNTRVRTGGEWAGIHVQPTPCTGEQVDTGWHVARFYAPSMSRPEGKNQTLLARDLTLVSQPSDELTLQVLDTAASDAPTFIGLPITDSVRSGDLVASMFVAVDGVTPVACYIPGVPSSTDGESGDASGCNTTMNGQENEWWRARNAKNVSPYSDAWALSVTAESTRNAFLWARGRGTRPWLFYNLGGGMHMVIAEATNAGSSMAVTANFTDGNTRNVNATVNVTIEQ